MAKLNDLYVFVETEDFEHIVETTDHAVEEGADLTDHVSVKGDVVSLKGQIVGENYTTTLEAIRSMQKNGTLIKYVGTETFENLMIRSFKRGKSNSIYGGCTFDMELVQARIAQSPYQSKNSKTGAKTQGGTQQKEKKSTETYVYHTVKKGDTVWALVNGPYKSLGSTCNQIMSWNPNAFSRKGDFGTLQIGAKLKMGVRK